MLSEKSSVSHRCIGTSNLIVTAMTFNSKGQIVIGNGNKVEFYQVKFNEGYKKDEKKPIMVIQLENIKEDTITAIHFPNQPSNESKFFIGTKEGKFLQEERDYHAQEQNQNINQVNLQDQNNQQNQNNPQNQDNPPVKSDAKAEKLHDGKISYMELKIITGSYDSLIKQFKINPPVKEENQNQPTQIQDECCLKHGPKEAVFWLSLSEITNGTQKLISSGYDNCFYIWERDEKKFTWHFKSKYKRNQIGTRVAFFGSDQIVWQILQQNYVKIVTNLAEHNISKEVEQNFKPNNLRQALFDQEQNEYRLEKFDNDKFPLLYNNIKEIMAIKYGSKIYFLRNYNQQLNFMPGKFIDCGLNCTEGAISPTGDTIVVYDSYRKSMIVYHLVDIIQS